MMRALDKETLDATIKALAEFAARRLTDAKLLELDANEYPVEIDYRPSRGRRARIAAPIEIPRNHRY